MADSKKDDEDSAEEGAILDQAGRTLGPRARQTRQRILEATVGLLREKSMRELRVIDIARRISSSPATFYQYFQDVEDVVLFLAKEASERTPERVEVIEGDWTGEAGYERARKLIRLAMAHFEAYAPILRVRNNSSDEGDERFDAIRYDAMMPMVVAFIKQIESSHKEAAESGNKDSAQVWEGAHVDPVAGATVLTSLMERMSMYASTIEEIGTSRENIIDTTAAVMQFVLMSRR